MQFRPGSLENDRVHFFLLAIENVNARKLRASLTGFAIAISVMTVVTMGVLTHSLRQTAISVLQTGKADFSVAQKGVSDVIYSSMDEADLTFLQEQPGVESTVGVLVAPVELDSKHPFFLQLGLQPDQLADFGVEIVAGRAYEADSPNEMMIGFRTAREFGKTIGDTMEIDGNVFTIVGIYSTGQVFGDQACMMPLAGLQARERKPGTITLAFVQVASGANIDAIRDQIESQRPELATVRTESEFGRVDRNLELISAANVGVSVLALVVGAVMVMNTMVLTVFERTREFGVLRAVGWSRQRVLALVMLEAVAVSLVGAAVGIVGGFFVIQALEEVPDLVGVFQPQYPASVFLRALAITFGMAFFGALYPALRAAMLVPLQAIRHE
ncbi:MAG: ABC transporter permease [Dehalococcoidia bacterium]